MPLRPPRFRLLTVLATALLLATGCTAGPVAGPDIVRGDDSGGGDQPDDTLPGLSAPQRDLDYRSCGDQLARTYGAPAPDGVELECASYDSPVDPAAPDGATISIAVVRVKLDSTPADAAPLVLTTGNDLPTSRLALNLGGDAAKPLLEKHPLVLVDSRGLGESGTVDCLTRAQRAVFADDAASGTRDVAARTTVLATAARQGADICNDTLSPHQLNFANRDAAADLEQLRSRWEVDRIGLVGVGSGSSVALAYLGAHPDRVGRLILDSPTGFNVQAPQAAAARAAGVQNSLAAFADRCANLGCSLGPDGAATLDRVVGAGASGSLPGLSDTSILTAITTTLALGDTDPDGLKRLSTAITEADEGNSAPLTRMLRESSPLRNSDGQQVAHCNNMVGRPGISEVPDLARKWAADAPMTANTAALSLARCDGWGVAETAAAPSSFPVPPLVLLGQNDPINGLKSAEGIIPLLITAGAEQTTVSWDGLGYSVLSRSDCAAALVVEYLGDRKLGSPAERACPA
ncbi:alpha/beta hydrolase [Gordonia iterans]